MTKIPRSGKRESLRKAIVGGKKGVQLLNKICCS
jgi:hypothetical protein